MPVPPLALTRMTSKPMARSGPPLTLRPYDLEDFEGLYAMDQVCYARGIAYSRRELRWFLSQRGAHCLVASFGKEIAGFLIAQARPRSRDESARRGHIITLDVLGEYRRRGIGRALVQAIEQQLRDEGVELAELETATDNQPAIAFWQNCGYRIAAVIPRYYLNRTDAFYMVKPLVPGHAAQET